MHRIYKRYNYLPVDNSGGGCYKQIEPLNETFHKGSNTEAINIKDGKSEHCFNGALLKRCDCAITSGR